MQLGAGDDRRPLVEQADDRADQPGLALAALAEQDDVVPGEQGALEVGQHGLVEADDAGEPVVARRIRGSRFSRISSLTVRCTCPDARSAPASGQAGGRDGATCPAADRSPAADGCRSRAAHRGAQGKGRTLTA